MSRFTSATRWAGLNWACCPAQPGTTGPQPLWGVSNIEVEFARLIELGASELESIAEVGEGIKVAAVQDPFGNRLGLIENPLFDLRAMR